MDELSGAETTIFTAGSDMTSEERSAVKSGEKRGEREAMKEDTKRFGLARQRGKNIRKYGIGYVRTFGHD
jgi:hypothetical protein